MWRDIRSAVAGVACSNGHSISDATAIQALARRHEEGTAPKAVSAWQLFPTPPEIAAQMVTLAGIEPGHRVLEPSAGTGRLLDAIHVKAVHAQ